jgi:catechol 2,3-dioxygenase-like lactoylglutathione lyase family enzyme
MAAPLLDGIHHVKVPVTDLARSRDWYASRLGYEVEVEFEEGGRLMGLAMRHPNGGPRLALRLDPERSAGAGDFDFFSIGVPSRTAIEDLARRLTDLGEEHAGVHFATVGWILPMLHDPDGHEVRFYTTDHHTEAAPGVPLRIADPRESAERRERDLQERQPRG